jgi:hypothetical protein
MHCQLKCRFNLATPDARHRRPLKFFLYHPSVKSNGRAKRQSVVQERRGRGRDKNAGVVARKSALEQDVPFLSIVI